MLHISKEHETNPKRPSN